MARKARRVVEQAALPTGCTAAYIRVSTEKQAGEGFSLEAQRQRIMLYCAAMNWRLCDEYVYVDSGLSGKTTDRPAFQRMMADARAGGFQRIVAVSLDRLARNTRDFLTIVTDLEAARVASVLLKENFDTGTPQGRFALTMFAALAELEAEQIRERTMSGRVQKALQGGNNGAPVPLGYDYDGSSFTPNAHAATVRGVFADYLAGMTLQRIADGLNARGVPTARGGRWYPSTVTYMLQNGFYAGFVQYDGQEVIGTHEPLISVADYEAAQLPRGKRA